MIPEWCGSTAQNAINFLLSAVVAAETSVININASAADFLVLKAGGGSWQTY